MIAASGERQQFVVPAASFGNVRNVAPQGLSAAVGRYQASRGSDSRTPLVATVSNGWSLGSRSTLNAGVLVSAPYRALAAGVSVNPSDALSASIGVRASSASFAGEAPGPADHGEPVGHAGRALVHEPVGHLADGRLSRPGAGGAGAAPGCQDLAQREPDLHRRRVLVLPDPGRLFRSLYHQPPVPPGRQAQPRDAVLEPELRPHLGQPVHGQGSQHGHAGAIGKPVFPDAELPLGSASASTYVSKSGNSGSVGATYSDTVSPQFSYSVSSSVARPDGAVNSSASIDAMPRYARVNLSANRGSQGGVSTNWGAGLGGGRGWRGGVLAL